MRVLVTGGTGSVGVEAVARLVRHGHQVRVMGRRQEVAAQGAEYVVGDVVDFEVVREAVRGMDGVVHLAAIPWPGGAPGQEIFRVNCTGTCNVYEAAAQEGIRRVVTASSINALGFKYGVCDFPIEYLPMDEEHPTYTTDPYSFSKQVTEEIGAYYWRRDRISGVSLRLPAVLNYGSEERRRFLRLGQETAAYVDELVQLPPATRSARVNELLTEWRALRAQRPLERRLRVDLQRREMQVALGRSDFWVAIDARDSAQAIERGLLADYQGSHPLFVNDNRNLVGVDASLLTNLFFPEVQGWKGPGDGPASLVSIDAARKLIAFEPEFHLC